MPVPILCHGGRYQPESPDSYRCGSCGSRARDEPGDLEGMDLNIPGIGPRHYVGDDHVWGRYRGSCCLAPDLRAEQTALYAAYKTWWHNQGAQVISSRAFAARTSELVGLASPKEMKVSNHQLDYVC